LFKMIPAADAGPAAARKSAEEIRADFIDAHPVSSKVVSTITARAGVVAATIGGSRLAETLLTHRRLEQKNVARFEA
jgi:hypothetical protein